MDIVTLLLRQGMLFAHLLAFSTAVSAVLREDLALLRGRRIEPARLIRTARLVGGALLLLWASGLALVALDAQPIAATLAASAKLVAKLVVVSALTANGIALHLLAFPMLRRERAAGPVMGIGVLVSLGAVSTASWLYASFIGVSRLVAPVMSLGDFLAIYGALLAGGIGIALAVVRPRLARMLANDGAALPRHGRAARGSAE